MATSSLEGTREVLAAHGLSIQSTTEIPYAGKDHRRIRFAPGTAVAAVTGAARALQADPRVSFVGHAYTLAHGKRILLINRLVVRFKQGVSPGQINRFIDSLGVQVLRAAAPDSAKPTYWVTYPRGQDPLAVAAAVHRHPLVQWAEPDRIGDVRRYDR